jgi:hypothetical protein
VFYKFPKQSFWAYCRGDAAIVYHEMFDMGSRLKDLQPLRDGDVVIDGGTNVGLFSLSVLQDESVQVACGWDCAWMVCIPCGVTWVHSGDLGPPLALLAVRGRPPVGCALPQGKKLTIDGFEPIKPTWEAAVRNLQGHSNVTVHNVVGVRVHACAIIAATTLVLQLVRVGTNAP